MPPARLSICQTNTIWLVCSGGDGTLDEVVEGMMHRQKKLPLGYIPSGTVNDFARSLKIPRDMVKAACLAVSGKDFLSDVGTFNNSHFVYIAAFGIFTDVAYSTPQDMKNDSRQYGIYLLEESSVLLIFRLIT